MNLELSDTYDPAREPESETYRADTRNDIGFELVCYQVEHRTRTVHFDSD